MKKSKLCLVLALITVFALVTPFVTYATNTDAEELTPQTDGEAVAISNTDDAALYETEDEDSDAVAEENLEEVKGNYTEFNTNIVLNKAVDGNAFLVGDKVSIQGKVNGDLYVIADEVNLEKDAQVYGNLVVVSNNLTHSGLAYNLFALTGNYTCEYDGLTALDVKVFADNVKFSGYTERSVYLTAKNIELTEDAYILGNFVHNSTSALNIAENATIYGETLSSDSFTMVTDVVKSNNVVSVVINILAIIASIIVILLVVDTFKPQALNTELKFNFVKCLKAFGIGILAFLASCVVIAFFAFSVLFTKLAFVFGAMFALALLLSLPLVIVMTSVMLHNMFTKGKSKLFLGLYVALVSLVYSGLLFVPFVNVITFVLVHFTGLGFIVVWLFNVRKANRASVVKEPKKVVAVEEKKADKKDAKKEAKKEAKKDNKKDAPKKDSSKKEETKKEEKSEAKKEDAKSEEKSDK